MVILVKRVRSEPTGFFLIVRLYTNRRRYQLRETLRQAGETSNFMRIGVELGGMKMAYAYWLPAGMARGNRSDQALETRAKSRDTSRYTRQR